MKKHYDWLIVGAGYTGSVIAERLATQCGKTSLVIDRRNHIAGNAYDRYNDAGVLYHQYGPHVFHTNAPFIADYMSQFTEWMPYEHRTLGNIDGRLVPIPFNLTSLQILFPKAEAERLGQILIETYGMEQKVPILKMKENPVQGIRDLADFIYQNVFYGYTTKQWGLEPEQLSPSVTARVPVFVSYDDRYFQDTFQNMPKEGYSTMFTRMLDRKEIDISLNTDIKDLGDEVSYDRLLYTGAIDEYFGYSLGELPYRSLNFDFQTYRQRNHQAVAQLNYPMSHDFTRISEMGHMTQQWSDVTTVAIEYPVAHVPGVTEPYYPIPRDENHELHNKYVDLARREAGNVIFCGRLGDYKYYNMDQAIGRALSVFDKQIIGGDVERKVA